MLVTAAVVAAAGAWGVVRAADSRAADVERVDGLDSVLAPLPGEEADGAVATVVDADGNNVPITYPAVNYLLVGSDSRENVSSTDPDAQVVGSASEVGGHRADTIMILRQEANGGLALTSVPRDLWLPIADGSGSQRINTAFLDGPELLAKTVTEALGVPIHHYVEVDFVGFKEIIDELGGVEVCVGWPARDVRSGLQLAGGCQTLDGEMALAFARSRSYQEWDGEQWATDGRADLGRIERQQLFIRAAIDGALLELQSSPFSSSDLVESISTSVKIDDRLDPFAAAGTLRAAAQEGIRTFNIPVRNTTRGDAAVLELGDGAQAVLDYFRGVGAAPSEYETTSETVAEAAPE